MRGEASSTTEACGIAVCGGRLRARSVRDHTMISRVASSDRSRAVTSGRACGRASASAKATSCAATGRASSGVLSCGGGERTRGERSRGEQLRGDGEWLRERARGGGKRSRGGERSRSGERSCRAIAAPRRRAVARLREVARAATLRRARRILAAPCRRAIARRLTSGLGWVVCGASLVARALARRATWRTPRLQTAGFCFGARTFA